MRDADWPQMTLRAFGPLLRPGGRLLVVASSFGILAWYDDAVALTDEPVRQDPGASPPRS